MKTYNSFGNISGQSYIIVDNDTIVEVSQSFAGMTEYQIDELLNKNAVELFGTLRVGPNFDIENIDEQVDYFLFTKSLDARFVNINVKEDGMKKVYIFSEKPNSRLDVKFSAVEALCSHNVFGIAVFSTPDITLLKANQTWLDFLDKPFNNRENSIGKKIYKIISGWIGSSSEDIWKNVLSTQKPFYSDEYMYEFERGVTYWQASLAPVFENGILKYCIEITTDITEKVLNRKKIQEQAKIIEEQNQQLRRQKEQLEVELADTKLLQSISMELLYEDKIKALYERIIDAAMQIMHSEYASLQMLHAEQGNGGRLQLLAFRGFSPQAAEFWQWVDAEYAGTTCSEALRTGNRVIVPDIRECDFIRGTEDLDIYIETGINAVQTTPLYSRSGKLVGMLSTHWREPHQPGERELGILDVLVRQAADLIEQRQYQGKILEAEREKNEALEKAMEMKDEFLSLISHEFRTPLNVINTAIQALNFIYPHEMTDKVKEYMGTIRLNTLRQLRLVNNLLDITRANAGRMRINKKNIDIVFLTKAIIESVYEFASHKGVRVTFVSTLAKKIIGIDDEKYERVILNLLSNAIKFTPEGKSIVVNLRSFKGNICVEVKDSGIGIPPNKIDVIFERFGQVDSSLSRQAEGTGIGLSLVKKFVEALGGSVSVKSKIGKGTTFTILLPNETVVEEQNQKPMIDLMNDNRLVLTTNIEFSDIYL